MGESDTRGFTHGVGFFQVTKLPLILRSHAQDISRNNNNFSRHISHRIIVDLGGMMVTLD